MERSDPRRKISIGNRRPSVAQSGTLLYRRLAIGGNSRAEKVTHLPRSIPDVPSKKPHRLHSRRQEKFCATFGYFFLCNRVETRRNPNCSLVGSVSTPAKTET